MLHSGLSASLAQSFWLQSCSNGSRTGFCRAPVRANTLRALRWHVADIVLVTACHGTAIVNCSAEFRAVSASTLDFIRRTNEGAWHFGAPVAPGAASAGRRGVAGVLRSLAVNRTALRQEPAGRAMCVQTCDLVCRTRFRTLLVGAPVHCYTIRAVSFGGTVAYMLMLAAVPRAAIPSIVAGVALVLQASHLTLAAVIKWAR